MWIFQSPTHRETKSLHDLHLAVKNSEDKRVTEFLTSDESQISPPSKGKTTKTDNVKHIPEKQKKNNCKCAHTRHAYFIMDYGKLAALYNLICEKEYTCINK